MKKYKYLPIFVVFLSLLLFLAPNVLASDKDPLISKHLVKEGIKYYENGKISEAIHNLSKALLADPDNEKARKYLAKIGLDDGAYLYQRAPKVQVASLTQAVHAYKNKVVDLEAQNAEQTAVSNKLQRDKKSLKGLVHRKNDEIGFLKTNVRVLEDSYEKHTRVAREKVEKADTIAREKSRENNTLRRIVGKKKQAIGRRDKKLVQKDENIHRLKNRLKLVKHEAKKDVYNYQGRILKQSSKYNNTIWTLKDRVRQMKKENELLTEEREQLAYLPKPMEEDLEEMFEDDAADLIKKKVTIIKQKDKNIAGLKEKLVDALMQIKALEEQGATIQNQAKIEALNKQIANITQRLEKSETSLQTKDSNLNLMEDRLSDAKERLTFVQKIVEEKEQRIKELESQITLIQGQCTE